MATLGWVEVRMGVGGTPIGDVVVAGELVSVGRRDRWPLVVAVTAVCCWSLGLGGLVLAGSSGAAGSVSWPDLGIGLAYPVVAMLVAHVRSARVWSAFTLLSAVFSAVNVASTAWADRWYVSHQVPTPGAQWAAWLAGWTWVVSVVGFVAVAFFPDGRLPSARWRFAPAALVVGGASISVGNAGRPWLDEYSIANPLPGPHFVAPAAVGVIAVVLVVLGLTGCLASVVVRFRRSDGIGRRQIGWYAYGYAVTFVVLVVAVTTNLPDALFVIGPVAVAAGAAVAILRYRLYEIDRIVHRTLTWGLLTVLVIALYAVCVGFLGRLFDGRGAVGGLVATGIVAVAFQPLRTAVQRSVNQLIYGYRDQPELVLAELSVELDRATPDGQDLQVLADGLVRLLRFPAVVLDVDGGPGFRASYQAGDRRAETLSVVAEARSGGTGVRIAVCPRGRRSVGMRDRQLLATVAPALASTAEAMRLRRALETSRTRAVAVLAEEQRRMRRDLHDGLGPVLAGLRLTIGSARKLVMVEPERADRILADAQIDAVAAIEDVRRLSHDLRPPALDELGLAAALHDRLDRLAEGAFQLTFTATDVPDSLPAAVEVAIYRIGCEAVLNAVRHAQARHCTVRLRGHGGGLELSVADEGVGLETDRRAEGVGLSSMRERAEELGGTIAVDGRPGEGTDVCVWLPVEDEHAGTS